MSLKTGGAGGLRINSAPTGAYSMTFAVNLVDSSPLNGGSGANGCDNSRVAYWGTYNDFSNTNGSRHFTQGSGSPGSDHDTGITSVTSKWVWVAVSWDGSNTLTGYYRVEGAATLTALPTQTDYSIALGGTNGGLWILTDTFGGFAIANSRASQVKVFSAARGQASLLAETLSAAVVDSTNIWSYLSCAIGSTIGQDTSGSSHDWTVQGSGLTLDTGEPTDPAAANLNNLFFGSL